MVNAAIEAWRSAMTRPADLAFGPAAEPMWTEHVSFMAARKEKANP